MQRFVSAKLGVHKLLRRCFYHNRRACMAEDGDDDLQTTTARHLDRLLSFAADSPYYGPLLTRRELSALPVLTKAIIRRRRDDLLTSRAAEKGVQATSSGGSTGDPITIVQDAGHCAWNEATKDYYFQHFLGVERGAVRSVWLWGSEHDLLKLGSRWDRMRVTASRSLQNMLFFNTFSVNEKSWLHYMEQIERFRPHYIAGYAGSLYQMATVAHKHNVRLYRPAFLHSSAELLRDFMRERIEEQFGARVYDFYGSREVGAIAGECASGRMHVFSMNNFVEVLGDVGDEGGEVAADAEGRLIVTNLHNYAMPLLRYEIGDTGSLSSQRCPCGSDLPVLQSLTGRSTDHFLLRDGTLVHGEFFTHLFYFRAWVASFQVDQLDCDRVHISVILATEPDKDDMREITASIRTVMGQECAVEWRFVDSIPKTVQGKHLYTRRLFD